MKSHITISPVIIPAQKRADSSYNIKIRLTYKRRNKILSTQLSAFPEDVTKSRPQKLRKNTNAYLRAMELVSEMYKAVADINYIALERMEVEDVAKWTESKLYNGQSSFRLDFFEWADEFIKTKSNPGTQGCYRTAVSTFRRYLQRDKIDINEISKDTIQGFIDFVSSDCKYFVWSDKTPEAERVRRTKKPGVAIVTNIPKIKAIYLAAQDKYNDYDEGIIKIPKNPFRTIKQLPKLAPVRNAKGIDDIQFIISYSGKLRKRERVALDLYILSFALMGMNYADMVEAPPAPEGVIKYRRLKTRTRRLDMAYMEVKIDERIQPLVDKYKDPTGTRLFNLYKNYSSVNTLASGIRAGLELFAQRVGWEHFTFYSARHSFATIARNNARIDKATVDECLNHVGSMKMADVYIEKDWSLLWDANKKVLDLFDWPETFGQDK